MQQQMICLRCGVRKNAQIIVKHYGAAEIKGEKKSFNWYGLDVSVTCTNCKGPLSGPLSNGLKQRVLSDIAEAFEVELDDTETYHALRNGTIAESSPAAQPLTTAPATT